MNAFAEIIEGKIDMMRAQIWKAQEVPMLGSIVVVDQQDKTSIFGVIYAIENVSVDRDRTPMVYQIPSDKLYQEQPQIAALLATQCVSAPIAYKNAQGRYFFQTPPRPPFMHEFVRYASTRECFSILQDIQCFRALFCSLGGSVAVEEVLLAFVARQIELKTFSNDLLERFAMQYFTISCQEISKKRAFLLRLQYLMQ